jgi:hypothetical protein
MIWHLVQKLPVFVTADCMMHHDNALHNHICYVCSAAVQGSAPLLQHGHSKNDAYSLVASANSVHLQLTQTVYA